MPAAERARALVETNGVAALAARSNRWRGIVVLAYHRIGDGANAAGDPDLWSATPDQLDRQLAFLNRHFDVIAPSEIPAAARARGGRFAAVTFDDGYRDGYDQALEVLRSHRVRAGFFICTGFLDRTATSWWDEIARLARRGGPPAPNDEGAARELRSRYHALPGDRARALLESMRRTSSAADRAPPPDEWMSWKMVRELRAVGMEIGGHTVTHPVLARELPRVQGAEITGCAARIEAELGEPMRLFSYPVGLRDTFDATTRARLRDVGVEVAFSCYGGASSRRGWDPLDVRRIPIGRSDARRFRRLVTLPARR